MTWSGLLDLEMMLAVISSRNLPGRKGSPNHYLSLETHRLWVLCGVVRAWIPLGQTEVSRCLSSLPAVMCATPGEASKDASGSLGCLPSGDDFSILLGRDTTVGYAGRLLSQSEWGSVLRTGWGCSSREHMCEHGFPRPPPGNHSWPASP